MPDNSFWNAVIKHYRNSIHIIFIGFFSLTNQWFITGSGPPSIFVSVVSSAVWTANCEQGIKFRKFRELWVSHWFLRELSVTELCKTRQFPEIYFPWNSSRNLYIGHLVIADTFSSKHRCRQILLYLVLNKTCIIMQGTSHSTFLLNLSSFTGISTQNQPKRDV